MQPSVPGGRPRHFPPERLGLGSALASFRYGRTGARPAFRRDSAQIPCQIRGDAVPAERIEDTPVRALGLHSTLPDGILKIAIKGKLSRLFNKDCENMKPLLAHYGLRRLLLLRTAEAAKTCGERWSEPRHTRAFLGPSGILSRHAG